MFAKKPRKGNSIFEIIYQQILKFSNLLEKGCPFPPNKYLVTNFKFDGSKLTSLVPSGIYIAFINVTTLENSIKTSFLQTTFEIKVER